MSDTVDYNLLYEPSDATKETISKLYERLGALVQMRNKSYSYFNNRSLTSYIDESMKRWNGYIPPRDDLSLEWQSHIFNNLTRNVTISYLSKVAMAPPQAKFVATNKKGFQDSLRAHILDKGVQYTRQKENGAHKFFQVGLEVATKGTVVAYEGYKKIKRKVKEIESYDPVTGKVKTEEREIVDYNDCFQQCIPLEEIYFGNLWVSDIQMQPDIIWKRVVTKQAFFEEFNKYPSAKFVKPGSYATTVETIPYYKQKEYFQLDRNSVEVVSWYNKWKDRLIITANGVLLYDDAIPFSHKQYPFAHTIFEPFAIDFIYGRSLPDKIASDQDVINTLWNMMLDQSYVSIYKPILTDDPDYINEYPLQPGRMFPVTSLDHYKVFGEMTGPDQSHFEMLQLAMKFANDNSGNMMGAGMMNPQKGKMTARQAMLQEEQMRQILGLNTKMLENFQIQATKLRAQNFMQFYTVPEKVQDITGEKDAMSNFYRVLRIDNTELSDGTYGTAVLKVAPKNKMPTADDLNTEEEVAAMQGENIEVHAVTPDYIRNMDYDVQVVGESSYTQSKTLKQATTMEFTQAVAGNPLFQQLINPQELLRDVIKVYDKDPDKIMKQMTPNPETMGAPPGQPGAPGGQPGGQPISGQVLGAAPSRSLERAL